MTDLEARVALIDSGVGGLSVLRHVTEALPGAGILYLADFDGLPYGGRSDAELAERLVGLQRRLVAQASPDALVVACNTASTLALEALRDAADFPIVGTVPPIKTAADVTRSGVIGLLATEATVRRPYVDRLIAAHAAHCRVIRAGSAGLVPLAEAALRGTAPDPEAIARELAPFLSEAARGLDVVALGCTHYPLIAEALAAALPPGVRWLDAAPAIARQLLRVLDGRGTGAPAASSAVAPDRTFLFTGPPASVEPLLPALRGFGFNAVRPLGEPAAAIAATERPATSP